MTEKITGSLFINMIKNGTAAINIHKTEINELNVFPVPDGDTGTNMSLTMSNGMNEGLKLSECTLTKAADTVASGLLRGARGNSGVILSLLFRGISKRFKGLAEAAPSDFADALAAGVDAAYKAVMKPTEGTILTVSRLASVGAQNAAALEGSTLESVFEAALADARTALADTVNLNPVLKKAGVVDSGGKGFVYILEGMYKAVRGEELVYSEDSNVEKQSADFSEFDTESIHFTYCTEFIVTRTNKKSADLLRAFLNNLGDSIVVVDDEEIIKTHVHTNDPGVVLTEALTYGTLFTVKIENMKNQHTEKVISSQNDVPEIAPAEKPFGMAAVCAGDGMAALFKELGVDAIITGGQTMNPSTEDILKHVNSVPAETVLVFPNNKNIIMAAQQCAPLTEKKVVVVETTTVPQGLSAVMCFDEGASVDENIDAMKEAAGNVHTASITYAARDSVFDGLDIKAGQYLSLLDGKLASNADNIGNVVEGLSGKLAAFAPEIITVYYGMDVTEADAEALVDSLSEKFPDADVSAAAGLQPVYYYIISAE